MVVICFEIIDSFKNYTSQYIELFIKKETENQTIVKICK